MFQDTKGRLPEKKIVTVVVYRKPTGKKYYMLITEDPIITILNPSKRKPLLPDNFEIIDITFFKLLILKLFIIICLASVLPNSFAFSARTGFGIDGLIRAIEKSLPHPNVEINALIPYDRGDLVSAVHERGEILSEEYVETGTQMRALVDGGLAKAIEDALL